MSDRDNQLHIGTKYNRAGSGGGQRPTVVRGKAALNAALRTGGVTTAKKFGSANSKSKNPEGQHLAKIDRTTTVSQVSLLHSEQYRQMRVAMSRLQMKQSVLAHEIGASKVDVKDWLSGSPSTKPKQEHIRNMERVFGVKLSGKNPEEWGKSLSEEQPTKEENTSGDKNAKAGAAKNRKVK